MNVGTADRPEKNLFDEMIQNKETIVKRKTTLIHKIVHYRRFSKGYLKSYICMISVAEIMLLLSVLCAGVRMSRDYLFQEELSLPRLRLL